jgi:O-antigen/teichoic acid export membrane protein
MSEAGEAVPAGASHSHDTHLAVRNAFILGSSLLATWSVALVVRLFLPRSLGPERFGAFNFADTLAASCAVALTLGIDTYIQKETPARPEHASDFTGGVVSARVILDVLLLAGMQGFVMLGHKTPEVQRTVLIFGVAQLASTNANSFAALLHASRRVGRLAVLNVATKVIWAGGVGAALLLHTGLEAFACAFLVSEVVRAVALWRHVRRNLGVRLRVDWSATKKAIRSSLPFYVNAAAIALYAKIDITIMSMLSSDVEVGWYGSAGNIAGIAMLLAPLMGWVLMPQLSRAAARADEELLAMFRRALELLLALAIPVSMVMGLSADVVIRVVFGAAFAPAIPSLEILSPMFVLTYLAMLTATTLILLGRGWSVTLISIGSLLLNALLNLLLLRPALRWLGPGGAGIAASWISVATEVAVALAMIVAIGGRSLDKKNMTVFAKSVGACTVVVAMHVALARIGPLRLLLDMVVYAAIVISTGAVRVGELYAVAKGALSRRKNARA